MNSRELTASEQKEYTEVGQWSQHDDTMIYQAAAVFLPVSFGRLAVAAQFPNVRWALAFFSLALYSYWYFTSLRLSGFSAVRLERAQILEDIAGLDHHKRVDRAPIPPWIFRVRKLRLWFFLILIGSWVYILSTHVSIPSSPPPPTRMWPIDPGKIVGIIAIACLALAVSPLGDGVDPAQNWFHRQADWLQRYWRKDPNARPGSPVRINPLLLWVGVILGMTAILLW